MADFIAFNEGRQVIEAGGWPSTVYFDLSTKAVSAFTATDTYATRAAITGTGYTNKSVSEPTSTALGNMPFAQMSWNTAAATNWQNPCSIVASDGSGKIFCAWNLVPGGAARDMSQAGTTLNVTPTYAPTNPP